MLGLIHNLRLFVSSGGGHGKDQVTYICNRYSVAQDSGQSPDEGGSDGSSAAQSAGDGNSGPDDKVGIGFWNREVDQGQSGGQSQRFALGCCGQRNAPLQVRGDQNEAIALRG